MFPTIQHFVDDGGSLPEKDLSLTKVIQADERLGEEVVGNSIRRQVLFSTLHETFIVTFIFKLDESVGSLLQPE